MNYPSIKEYKEAILFAEDNFEQLKNLRPVLGEDGEPVMTSGNFAVVFKMKDEQTGKLHAVKCFLREQEGRAEAYRMIAEELEYVSSTFLTPIKYLDKELFVDTNAGDDKEFPVLLMDWVEGETLDKYIRKHLDDQYELALLAYQFSRLAMWLMPQPFAHGDLKPDNILVKNDGTLVLVDYDGMYVPVMKGQEARELGSPDFRHPSRTETDFDEHIDDFSLASILLSLKAFSLQPSLLEEFGAQDRLLFSEKDYRNLSESEALNALRPLMQDAELASLYSLFILALSQNNLSKVSFRLFNLYRPDMSKYEDENLSTKVTEEDLANAWTDEYGVKYSKDRKRLLFIPNEITDYRIRKGTKVICDYAFGNPNSGGKINNNLRSIYLPASIKVISSDTLFGSQYLSQITVDEKNTIFDSRNNCNAIIRTDNNELLLGCHSTVIPSSISVIADNAFLSCVELKTIVIPSSVEYIGESAFMNCCQLNKIHLPASIKELCTRAFNGCDIEIVTVDKDNCTFDSRDNCKAIISSADNRLVFGCKNTIIPNTVSAIGYRAFECCELEELCIPNSVNTIESSAFLFCSELKSVVFSSSLTRIEDSAFCGCRKLESMTFLGSVKFIGSDAFFACNSIKSILIPKGTRANFMRLNLGWDLFSKLVEKDLNENIKTIVKDKDLSNAWIDEYGVMYSKDGKRLLKAYSVSEIYLKALMSVPPKDLDEYNIQDGTEFVCDDAFQLSGLTKIIFPPSMIGIGKSSFSSCSQLRSIHFSSNIKEIGSYAFYGCTSLQKIFVPIGTKSHFEELLPEYKDKLVEQNNGWKEKGRRSFSSDEIAAVARAEVVPSQYGNSVCFFMKTGGQTYIPLSQYSSLAVGDIINLKTAKLITLSREGDDDIYRVEA